MRRRWRAVPLVSSSWPIERACVAFVQPSNGGRRVPRSLRDYFGCTASGFPFSPALISAFVGLCGLALRFALSTLAGTPVSPARICSFVGLGALFFRDL